MDGELQEVINQYKDYFVKETKFSRGLMMSGMGQVYWEEPLKEFEERMLKIADEYLEYLKEKRKGILDKMQKEVDDLSVVINDFERKMKEKELND